MKLIEIPVENIAILEPLWRELNALHLEKSSDFKEYFAAFTFEERCEKWLAMDDLKIVAVRKNAELVGYCIASLYNGRGEIDSIFLQPHVRGALLGKELMESALSWLSGRGCTRISISVVEGNEAVISFYEKFGFKVKHRVLELKGA